MLWKELKYAMYSVEILVHVAARSACHLIGKAEGEVAVEERKRGCQVHVGQRQPGTAARPLHKWQETADPPLSSRRTARMQPTKLSRAL